MIRIASAFVLGALSLAACGTIAPEDYPRRISMNWNLAPDNAEVTRRTIEAGDVILSWKATAKATHVMDLGNGAPPTPLVTARTSLGQLYCNQTNCYEDRDGDGALDYMWQLGRNWAEPKQAQQANAPVQLKVPVSFRAIEATGAPIFEQLLGLVYSGPMEGVPKEDQTLSPMLGELTVGWIGGPTIPRTPDGSGWSEEQSLPVLLAEGVTPKTTVKPLDFTYMPLRATIDGMLELEFQARAVENVDLDAKLKFSVDGKDVTDPQVDKTLAPPQT